MNLLLYHVAAIVSFVSTLYGEDPGTTPHLSEIFTGRCWDYKLVKFNKLIGPSDDDCEKLWNTFFDAFAFKAPCSLSQQNYEEFMDSAKQKIPSDKAMFWSGTYVIAHEYAQDSQRFVTLEDTLIGYLANSLVWCGSATDPSGVNTTRCPAWTDCPLESSESFWAAASTTFAKSANGIISLVLDGSREGKPAYSKQSFFAKYELPNLSVTEVTKVRVIVTHTLGGPFKETCKNGSLVDLEDDVKSRNLNYECVDDPPAILHLLCSEDPKARECKLAQLHMQNPRLIADKDLPLVSHNYKPDRFSY